MSKMCHSPAIVGALLLFLLLSATAHAHAALDRSDPAAGTVLTDAPGEIRIWLTEPLEQTYTGADLLDATGAEIAGVTVTIAPENTHQLSIVLPANLPDGNYTVSWRTLSSADGHTLEGYFGFRIGEGPVGEAATAATGSAQSDPLRGLSRGLALIGLAALLAIAPMTLGVFDPVGRSVPTVAAPLAWHARRYAMLAGPLAVLGSLAALVAQATAIAPDATIVSALAQTLGDTRYGSLWLVRMAMVLSIIALIAAAFWGSERWRRPFLVAASAMALVAPVPFSLLSHAAAQESGRAAAITIDAIHLLAASVWAGGLFLLALVLAPALLTVSPEQRRAALGLAIPRFSALGLAAWGVLVLSGLYAAWLQVGTIEALRDTDYGRTLLLKGAFLLPVLALAAFHFLLGWRGVSSGDAMRTARTFAVEALIVLGVLMVVGRLIGLEPAREVVASRNPGELSLPLTFNTSEGERTGKLTISPGIAGANTFVIEMDGDELPSESEGVLRFSLPSQEIGEQELRLSSVGPNRFSAEGSDLALTGEWQISVIVRQIGSFSWATELTVPIGNTALAVQEPNPAPRLAPVGIGGLIAISVGICALAAAVASRRTDAARRAAISAAGVLGILAGSLALSVARVPEAPAVLDSGDRAVISATETETSTPDAMTAASPEASEHMHHGTPLPETRIVSAGTPVSSDGLSVVLDVDADRGVSTDVTVSVFAEEGQPVSEARVVVLSEMAGMSGRGETTAIESGPGRYVAAGVPLTMAGEWRLTVRVSPKGQSTQVIPFLIDVP